VSRLRPPDDELARRWAAVHGGMRADANPVAHGWLRLMWRLASPLARRGVPPNAITASGALLGAAAVGAALAGQRAGAGLALLAMLLSALADGLDGAVAILSGRATARGACLDRWADRVVDACWALVLWALGAPLWAAAALVAASLVQEGWRHSLGSRTVDLITVCERPTRLVCAALAAFCVLVAPQAGWTTAVCSAVWGATALIALAQLAARARRR
jgi:phosphatidylglycerophosphate synthase